MASNVKIVSIDELTKSEGSVKGITHNGLFHADDAVSAAILGIAHDGIVRIARVGSVPAELADAIVFDVGGGKYDHHHELEYRPSDGVSGGVPYAACGLLWRDYGPSAIRRMAGDNCLSDAQVQKAWAEVDFRLCAGVDAIDNGVYPRTTYLVEALSFNQAIKILNPCWDEDSSPDARDRAFERAVEMATLVLERSIKTATSKVAAAAVVEQAIAEAGEGGQVIFLPRFVPWQEYVQRTPTALYVVFPSPRGGWNVQAVPLRGRVLRKPFPEDWRGREGDLAEVSGVADARFCHKGGYLAVADSRAGAEALARRSIEADA